MLYESLKKSELTPAQMQLLYKSGALGHKMTAKEQVTRAYKGEQLGVALSDVAHPQSKSAALYTSKDAGSGNADEFVAPTGKVNAEVDDSLSESDTSASDSGVRPAKRVRWELSREPEGGDHDDDDESKDDDDKSDDDDDDESNDDDEDEDDDKEDDDDDLSENGEEEDGLEEDEPADQQPIVLPHSKFQFSVSLSGLKKSHEPIPIAANDAEMEPVHSSHVLLSGRHKIDHAYRKLQELRDRNSNPECIAADVDELDQSILESIPVTTVSALTATAAEIQKYGVALPLASAADLELAREHLDIMSRNMAEGEDAAVPSVASFRNTASLLDPNMLRAAMWSADGSTRLHIQQKRAYSHFAAYIPAPVTVRRDRLLQESRSQLPVCGMEAEIMEALNENDVVVLCGETGSGKTTQIPQFLYEAGYAYAPDALTKCEPTTAFPNAKFRGIPGLIAVTQPRRVAATATAQRVADELGCGFGAKSSLVGYQVRYDASTITPATKIKFMTDGILLREIQEDLVLRKYSVIVLDEAHERNLNTDVLIGLLSRAVPLRNTMAKDEAEAFARGDFLGAPIAPLKLVIMSATLRVSDFTENSRLFPIPPPVINVQGRQFPVNIHFARRTELLDFVTEAYKCV
jgi:flagellar biosynthesis GTPase FlhF